jgi:hypothetical protein
VGLANLGSESETCVGSRVRIVGVPISFEKNFYRLPFTPPPPFLVRRIGPSVTREEHGHWRRGSTAVAARWWRVESGAGAVEREREREREKERERVGRGERWIWESNRAVKGRSTS